MPTQSDLDRPFPAVGSFGFAFRAADLRRFRFSLIAAFRRAARSLFVS